MNKKGFTLIELLVVIAIIAILAVVVFVALDPATRFADARDAVRSSDTAEILSAIKIDQVDNGGAYVAAITALTDDEVYMISDAATGCDDQNAYCDTAVASDTHCVDLAGLVTEGYLGAVPVSPNGSGTWTTSITGYTLEKNATGTVQIRACESENSTEIEATR
jgi:prepilin-type N-terminal cleavage/methylation domain-containing protein